VVAGVDELWLQSVVSEETAINQQLQAFFPNERLRLYQTTTPFPVEWLTLQEQAFFETLKHPNRQASWLLGRTLLKFLACQQSDLVPLGVENPLDTIEAWHFPHQQCSVSHTERVAYVLVNLNQQSAGSVGLDVEGMSRKPLSLKALGYLLSEAERMDLQRLQLENPEERWDLRYWTAKEALYKATPDEHQGNIQLNSWQMESLNNVGMSQTQAVTKTDVLLTGCVFNTVTPCLQSRCSISVALVEDLKKTRLLH
jgi:phosphopantetheinyl transferase